MNVQIFCSNWSQEQLCYVLSCAMCAVCYACSVKCFVCSELFHKRSFAVQSVLLEVLEVL